MTCQQPHFISIQASDAAQYEQYYWKLNKMLSLLSGLMYLTGAAYAMATRLGDACLSVPLAFSIVRGH